MSNKKAATSAARWAVPVVTDALEDTARRIAGRGRDILRLRLRAAFHETIAAHPDMLKIDDEELERLVQSAADRADGVQWRRVLVSAAVEELHIGLEEALVHPAVAKAHEILEAPSYEESVAKIIPSHRLVSPVTPADCTPPNGPVVSEPELHSVARRSLSSLPILARGSLTGAALALPGALTVYVSFHAGGFFAGTPALLAVVLTPLILVRVAFAEQPLRGMSRGAMVGAGSLALLAVWVLLSALWSHSIAPAVIEFDRVLVYFLAFVFSASLIPDLRQLRWMVRIVAGGIAGVCLVALISRTLPMIWPTSPDAYSIGLSYPLTYSNALGVLAAVGIILCLGLGADSGEPRALRVLAASLVPMLGATLLLTFSRGAIAAGCAGALAIVVLARPRALIPALLAIVPTTTIAILSAIGAHDLTTPRFLLPRGLTEGRHLALIIAVCAVGAAAARAVLLRFDDRPTRAHRPVGTRPRPGSGRPTFAFALGLMVAAALALAIDLPGWLHRQYDRFTHGNVLTTTGAVSNRLTDPGNDGRLEFWRVAVAGFRSEPVHGQGAGTYQFYWTQHRHSDVTVVNAHSLYLQTMSDLGLVGILVLAVLVSTILIGLHTRARAPGGALFGTLFAATLVWVLHSAVDWDWQMPASTLWVFLTAGAAVAWRPPGRRPRLRLVTVPQRLLLACAFALPAVVPVSVILSHAPLVAGAQAFDRGNCPRAVASSLSSISALDIRPEPYELIAYCDSRAGLYGLSVRMMSKAVTLEPRNWEYWYGLALMRGAAGLDPRPAAREALLLNPRSPLTLDAAHRFATSRPGLWQRRARSAPLPL